MPHYRHTQVGYLQIFVFGGGAVGLASIILRHAVSSILYLLLAVMLFLLLFFSTLTVQIDDEYLSFWFNIGWFRRNIALPAIQHHSAAKSSAREGWGIRFTPVGKLYNVSGLDCLDVVTKGGERIRIGTDEPELLERQLGYAMAHVKVPDTKGTTDSEPGPRLHTDEGIEGE
jgi:hypothetical protein